ncbi:cation diffusion facilitator family transporter [uncultured Methanoregula sp.]|uniref:cation diffusion facilitator family transporter n=1 Tax=uncultured Methanoregula sp. TaxID=1005933 RepID=UPI002AAB3F77|nr:cation diffusion facilitator family transporter [uncultured Methanoregula sp.]
MAGQNMHEHDHGHDKKRSLRWAIGLTALVCLAEIGGGLLSGSLSLLGDAAHMLQDTVALFLSLGAIIIAEQLPTPTRTFGYHRVEIGAAVANGLLLIMVSVLIITQALERFAQPRAIESTVMLGVAVIGLMANIAAACMLHGSHDLNVKSAFLHVIGDTLSSIAVIVAAVWIALTGQTLIDPVLGILIAGVIIISSFSIMREAFAILLQFAPRGIDISEIIRDMESVEGVGSVHNIHFWTLCPNINILDAHVYSCETNARHIETMRAEIKRRLEKYLIGHSTLEFECERCGDCRVVQELRD